MRDNLFSQDQSSSSKSSNNRDLVKVDNLSEENNALKSNNINYFNSIYKREDSIVIISRYIFYKNVYTFVDYLKDFAIIKNNYHRIISRESLDRNR